MYLQLCTIQKKVIPNIVDSTYGIFKRSAFGFSSRLVITGSVFPCQRFFALSHSIYFWFSYEIYLYSTGNCKIIKVEVAIHADKYTGEITNGDLLKQLLEVIET